MMLLTDPEVIRALEHLIDVSTQPHYNRGSDETFIECLCCGAFEGHEDACPVPLAIKALEE